MKFSCGFYKSPTNYDDNNLCPIQYLMAFEKLSSDNVINTFTAAGFSWNPNQVMNYEFELEQHCTGETY
jgi:hypothetical protein